MNNSSVLMEQLVRISDVLDWSAENAASYNLAIAIVKEMTGAALAPTFLLDATATELVLLADDEFSRLPPAFETMPAWMHVRQPWVNSQARPSPHRGRRRFHIEHRTDDTRDGPCGQFRYCRRPRGTYRP